MQLYPISPLFSLFFSFAFFQHAFFATRIPSFQRMSSEETELTEGKDKMKSGGKVLTGPDGRWGYYDRIYGYIAFYSKDII